MSPEERELLAAIESRLSQIESKLNLVARSIGGPSLVRGWEKLEADAGVGIRSRTFSRRRVREAEAGE